VLKESVPAKTAIIESKNKSIARYLRNYPNPKLRITKDVTAKKVSAIKNIANVTVQVKNVVNHVNVLIAKTWTLVT
jgi:hypothetical protein